MRVIAQKSKGRRDGGLGPGRNTRVDAFRSNRMHEMNAVGPAPTSALAFDFSRVAVRDDAHEHAADRTAERIMSMSTQSAPPRGPQRRTDRRASAAGLPAHAAPPSVYGVLNSPGEPLGKSARDFFEPRFGANFSDVRVHSDSAAAESARDMHARAYTVGTHIVVGRGEYRPDSAGSRSLMAHELAHVVQQATGVAPHRLQRKAAPDANAEIKKSIRKSASYPAEASMIEQIIRAIDKKPEGERPDLFQSLLDAVTTTVKKPEAIAKETSAATATAGAQEKARLSSKKQADLTGIEEAGSADPARQWTPVKGKFGGGTYLIDARNPNDIHIKAKVWLHAAGQGTQKDVDEVKGMQDAIEKAASTFGYSVDIEFPAANEPGAFDVTVDPGKWEVATNWAGGAPRGYAHELHHLMSFELDRYNYITNQSTNPDMKVHDRLIWFQKELAKPPGYDDPMSIMGELGEHPLDSDVCTVAGLDPKACQQQRHDARQVRDSLLDAINRSDGTGILVAADTVPDSLRGPMIGDGEVLTAVDNLPAKARVIIRARLQFGGNKIPPKVRQLVDAALSKDANKAVDLLKTSRELHGPWAAPLEDLGGIKAAVVDVFVGDSANQKRVDEAIKP